MIKLSFWFGGVIASYATFDEAETVFEDVIAKLAFLYGGNSDSIAPLKEVKSEKPVGEADYEAHLAFYLELIQL